MNSAVLVVFAIIIQLVLLFSVFDIYFVSPIINGLSPIPNNVPTSCKRIAFISVDGLRVDSLLENDEKTGLHVAPFVRRMINEWGAWGISHCHLPTESRPGHVAMLAGFYEDPSAVTKGWKENPVDFDSVLNRSSCSFSWGSPDIVHIFYKGLQHNCSYKWTYSEQQDFAGNTMALDDWVYDNLKTFLEKGNETLYSQPQSLFFLHLLGQDTSGHTHKPWTKRYRDNLINVDKIIKNVDYLFNNIFRDNKTSFIVTADHGMTNWGSHGAGHPSETLTPIVTWGCGIQKQDSNQTKLNIDQADIAPLLSVLLGVSIPVNSIGILPTSILNMKASHIAEANFLNAQQISQQYLAKRLEIESKVLLSKYRSFETLSRSSTEGLKESITKDIRNANYDSANAKSRDLIKLSLGGMKYYQNYFQTYILCATSFTCLGWILLLLLYSKRVDLHTSFSNFHYLLLFMSFLLSSSTIHYQSLPLTYHAYALLPIFIWWLLLVNAKILYSFFWLQITPTNVFYIVLFVLGIQVLVFGFFHRWALSINLAAIVSWGLHQIYLRNGVILWQRGNPQFMLTLFWSFSGLALAIFTVMPVIGKEPNPYLVLLATCLFLAASWVCSWHGSVLKNIHLAMIFLAGVNNFVVHTAFPIYGYLNIINQVVSWALFILSICLLFKPASDIYIKIESAYGLLAVPFLLLSISHEGLFLFALFIHMFCWIELELLANSRKYSSINSLDDAVSISDFRKAYFFLAYIYIAFFGVGNIDTMNSFDVAWVRCFITTFYPFTMVSLLFVKVIIPFFVVSLAMRVLTIFLDIRPYKLFLLVLIYCNVMGIDFLFLVRNEGSWLDIGTSLSHYIIQQITIVFLLLLFSLAQLVVPPEVKKVLKMHTF